MDELRQMVDALWLTDEIHWDIFLYVLFFINIVLLFLHPSGDSMGTNLSILILLAIVIDKVHGFGYMFDPDQYSRVRCHEEIFIGTYLIRVVMFAGPLIIAGRTRRPGIRPAAIVVGLLGGAYMFIRWYMEQRDVSSTALVCWITALGFSWQSSGVFLVMARLALRQRFRLGTVYRDVPVVIARDVAAHDVEVEIA